MPDIHSRELWQQPATREDVETAVAHLLTICEPEASRTRVQMFTRLLASYEYTRAELLLAMREVPRDPEASHNYGRGFNLADIERVIKRRRKQRAMLRAEIPASKLEKLLMEYPELEREEFAAYSFVDSVGSERTYVHVPTRRRMAKEKE